MISVCAILEVEVQFVSPPENSCPPMAVPARHDFVTRPKRVFDASSRQYRLEGESPERSG